MRNSNGKDNDYSEINSNYELGERSSQNREQGDYTRTIEAAREEEQSHVQHL